MTTTRKPRCYFGVDTPGVRPCRKPSEFEVFWFTPSKRSVGTYCKDHALVVYGHLPESERTSAAVR
jgi:hypothetical protein